MAQSRVYTSTTAADVVKLLLLSKRPVTHYLLMPTTVVFYLIVVTYPNPNVMRYGLLLKSNGFFRGPCATVLIELRENWSIFCTIQTNTKLTLTELTSQLAN